MEYNGVCAGIDMHVHLCNDEEQLSRIVGLFKRLGNNAVASPCTFIYRYLGRHILVVSLDKINFKI